MGIIITGTLRVFVSIPMSGRSPEEFEERLNKTQKYLLSTLKDIRFDYTEIQFVDTFTAEIPVQYKYSWIKTKQWLLGNALNMMSSCDVVLFADDWYEARGCLVEKYVCDLYNIPHIIEGDNPDKVQLVFGKDSFQ